MNNEYLSSHKSKMQIIKDCKDVDLNKHGLIEASAGTGKTYTIENLVVRILEEKDVLLDKILLVTFTEKATSELKNRIRENIKRELCNSEITGSKAKRLNEALVNFDSASIYTIHGFCQSVLRDYSFENSQLFNFDVVNDEPLYERMIYEQMRRSWPEQYGEYLPDILEISGFPKVNRRKGESEWINQVLRISRDYCIHPEHCLMPDISGDCIPRQVIENVRNELSDVLDMAGFVDGEDHVNSDLYKAYEELNFNKKSKTSRLEKIILPLLAFLSDFKRTNEFNLRRFSGLIEKWSEFEMYNKDGILSLVPINWNPKSGSNLDEKCPYLEKMVRIIKKITETVKYMLSVMTIQRLKHDVEKYKRKNGMVSFDDMLTLVARAIDNDSSGLLMDKLRDKYKYALVDEFQDTDAIQWKIFHEIFLKGKEQRLFLIGDPKQAIYSFRGADINTYLTARKEIKVLSETGRALIYSLETNWRSGPGLIRAFNHLFKQDDWFGCPDKNNEKGKIAYREVSYPDSAFDGISNERGRTPLTLVKIKEERSVAARKKMAEFIASEINYLANRVCVKEKDGERKLDYGDVCVLVRGKSEVSLIEEEFDLQDIPHTYYKKPGLYQSDEALELTYLFRAIDKPGDESAVKKGLLTSFFNVPLADLGNYSNLQPDHPVKILLQNWNEHVFNRRWSCLFQSIIEDSGILLCESGKPNGDRKLTNYRHIMQNLEILAVEQNLDFAGIIYCLESYRRQALEIEGEVDLHQIESERSKVKIMTIHSSKGLEFSVVFLSVGFAKPSAELFYKYYENGTTVFDLAKSNEGKERHRIEQNDENLRLYYVALTRAKYRVYVPELELSKSTKSDSPASGFIFRAIQSMKTGLQSDESKKYAGGVDCAVSMADLDGRDGLVGLKKDVIATDQLLPSESFGFSKRMIRIESFSSINYKKEKSAGKVESYPAPDLNYQVAAREKSGDEIELKSEHGATDDVSELSQLPRGKQTGNMLHLILENINFETVDKALNHGLTHDYLLSDNEISALIDIALTSNHMGKNYRGQTARLIWNTLTTPITEFSDDFALANLKNDLKMHEMEFYFPFEYSKNFEIPEEIKQSDGFLTGFIDMVFCYKGLYFIVDWKSNYIEDGYDMARMQKKMDESNYHLQYQVYSQALLLWMEKYMGEKFYGDKNFGGVLYLFLRGMGTGKGNGVYYRTPEQFVI